MPRQKGMTQLELLRRKQAEIADQLKAAEAKERERESHLESRRKELLGAVIADYLKEASDSALAKTLFDSSAKSSQGRRIGRYFLSLPPPTPAQAKAIKSAASDADANAETA